LNYWDDNVKHGNPLTAATKKKTNKIRAGQQVWCKEKVKAFEVKITGFWYYM